MNSTRFRHGFVYLLIILAVAVIILGAFTRQDSPDSWSMTDVADAAKAGRISEIVVRDNNELVITLTDGDVKMSRKDANSTALEQLLSRASPRSSLPPSSGSMRRPPIGPASSPS